jgi:hypothetical protein
MIKENREHKRDPSTNLQLLFCHLFPRRKDGVLRVDLYLRESGNTNLTVVPRSKSLSMMAELKSQRIKILYASSN